VTRVMPVSCFVEWGVAADDPGQPCQGTLNMCQGQGKDSMSCVVCKSTCCQSIQCVTVPFPALPASTGCGAPYAFVDYLLPLCLHPAAPANNETSGAVMISPMGRCQLESVPQVMVFLNSLFSVWDTLLTSLSAWGVYKAS
jgi:hypothetical protein